MDSPDDALREIEAVAKSLAKMGTAMREVADVLVQCVDILDQMKRELYTMYLTYEGPRS